MRTLYSLLFILLLSACFNIPENDPAKILALRGQYNENLKARDVEGILGFLTEDYLLTTGAGNGIVGTGTFRNDLNQLYSESPDIYFVRNPLDVVVSKDGTRAWENGNWSSYRPETEGYVNLGGNYAAYWIKKGDRWLVRSELFVTLE